MGQVLEIGLYYWLGAAATTVVIMAVVAAACLIKNGKLPEQDITYWQGLLIYLPIEAVPAAMFALTAAISSAAEIFPRISATGSGLVGLITAGAIQVVVATIVLWGDDDNQRQNEQWQLSKLDERDLIRQMKNMLQDSENPRENKEPRLTVQKRRSGSILRIAFSVPVLVFLVLPIVLYVCVQLLAVRP
jgi:hypothetical protein